MTTYRLPDGTEVGTADLNHGPGINGSWLWIDHPTLGQVFVSADLLVEVEPPLLDEPDVRAVELGGRVWTRAGWPGEYHWESPGFHGCSWLALNQLAQGVPIVPLAPDPAANAVLPFVGEDRDGDRIEVTCKSTVVHIRTFSSGVDLDPDVAEQTAFAILRAAREAKEKADA